MLKPIIVQLLLERLSCFDISAQVVEITSFSCGGAQLSGASLLSTKTSPLTGSLALPSHVTYQTDKRDIYNYLVRLNTWPEKINKARKQQHTPSDALYFPIYFLNYHFTALLLLLLLL